MADSKTEQQKEAEKLPDTNPQLTPNMKSTDEAIALEASRVGGITAMQHLKEAVRIAGDELPVQQLEDVLKKAVEAYKHEDETRQRQEEEIRERERQLAKDHEEAEARAKEKN